MTNCTAVDEEEDGGGIAFTVLIFVMICFIALSMGCTITVEALKEVWTTKRRAFLIGIFSQFLLMPPVMFGLSHAFGLPSRVAIGVVLIGSAPGGSTSNLLTSWSFGNVALSVAMSATSTVCALFMLPLNIEIYINTGLASDGNLELPFRDIILTLLSIVLPVALGMLLRRSGKSCGPTGGRYHAPVYVWVMKAGNVVGFLFLVGAFVTGLVTYPELLNPGKYPAEWGLAAMFQPLGCAIGFVMAKAAKLDEPDVRAVALETGIQSYPLILALVSLSFKVGSCEWEEVSRFVLISTFWYIISSLWIVTLMRLTARREAQAQASRKTDGAQAKTDVASISLGSDQAI